MGTRKYKVWLLLGSNLGNCRENLRRARVSIEKKIGCIFKASQIYNSQAWGFESEDVFYNQALFVETSLAPFAAMECILDIEKELGRIRLSDSKNNYSSRIIDIDIIFFEDFIIRSKLLSVPHPRLHLRRFVLVPMSEIAPDLVHPEFNKTIAELTDICQDKAYVGAPELPSIETPDLNFIAIEGNIGSGKTSLASRIARDYGAKLVVESFEENVFLPKFYENKERYAFPVELTFLAERYRQAKDEFVSDLFSSFIVSDFVVSKSLVFARKTLSPEEYNLFSRLFKIILLSTPKPDLYVYLHSTTQRLKKNIIKRGRDYELNMDQNYLQLIEDGYLEYIRSLPPEKVLIVPCDSLDFVGKEEDYRYIMELISEKASKIPVKNV